MVCGCLCPQRSVSPSQPLPRANKWGRRSVNGLWVSSLWMLLCLSRISDKSHWARLHDTSCQPSQRKWTKIIIFPSITTPRIMFILQCNQAQTWKGDRGNKRCRGSRVEPMGFISVASVPSAGDVITHIPAQATQQQMATPPSELAGICICH